MSQSDPETLPADGSPRSPAPEKTWDLRLFIAGESPKSRAALANLRKLCEQYLQGRYSIEVIDLVKNPALARHHQIIAIPTLIRELPEPIKRVIGDLSDADKALVALDVQPGSAHR